MTLGVVGSRQLEALKGDQTLWTDRVGFISSANAFPELYRGVLVFRGVTEHVAIGFVRVYAPDSGKLLWDLESEAEVTNQQVLDAQLAGDRVVVLREGTVTSRELTTGKVVWSDRSDRPPLASATRVLVFDDDRVNVLDA
jgi:outer membrane protein assembly factor BamB